MVPAKPERKLTMGTTSLVLIGEAAQRDEIKHCLSGCQNLRVAGEIGEIAGLRLVPRLTADVIVVDCAAPGLNSLIILPWLRGLAGPARVLALGASGSAAERQFLLGLGADLYATLDTLAAVLARFDCDAPAAPGPPARWAA